MALVDGREIGTHAAEIDFALLGDFSGLDLALLDKRERIALENRVALRRNDSTNYAAKMRADDVLHLHRFHHEELLAAAHHISLAHIHRNDRPLDRRPYRNRVRGSGEVAVR